MSSIVADPTTLTEAVATGFSGQMLELDEDEDLEVFSKDTTRREGSSINASIPNSPASMINQYKFEEESNTKDLFITVDNPESHVTALETFITYRVETKTTRSEYDSCEFEVRRRYQDFLWLKGRLEEAFPTLIIHPLPEKFVIKGMVERFNEDFIEVRQKALHKFLNRIADHPILSCNEDFKVFLTAQAWELTSHKRQGPGFLSRMGGTVRAVAATMRGVRNRPEEFTAIQEYVESFSQKITSLDKVSQRIVKEQKEYVEELKEYGPTYTLWSGSEEELVEPLKGVACCIDRCCRASEELVAQLSENLVPVLHEYVLCAETLKAVLRRRDNIQAEYEAKNDMLANKKIDRETLKDSKDLGFVFGSFLGKTPEETQQQKQQKLDGEIEEIKEELEKLEDRVKCANSALKVDWARWQGNMQEDIKATFLSTAERNVEYYEKIHQGSMILQPWSFYTENVTATVMFHGWRPMCLAVWESFLLSQRPDLSVESSRKHSS